MNQMILQPEQIKQFVSRACREVEKNDSILFVNDISEWAIAHRMALYLEKYFPEFNVDCEYNRMADNDGTYNTRSPKRVAGTAKSRPDIIVHKRGPDPEYNLVVIELKKDGVNSEEDQQFLKAMMEDSKFNYDYAYQVIIYDNGTLTAQEVQI